MLKLSSFIFCFMIITTYMCGQCIGESGQVSWLYWECPHVDIEHLYVDDTYPKGPDNTRKLNSLSTPYNYKDFYGAVTKGFIIVPEATIATFNVTGDDGTYFYLSSDETKENLNLIAQIDEWTERYEHTKYPSQTSTSIALASGQHYYFELHHKNGWGGNHSAVFWQRPFVSQENWNVIPYQNIVDICDDYCPPKGETCDDNNPSTYNDMQDGSCNCVGTLSNANPSIGERGKLDAYFYEEVLDGQINTLMIDPDYPMMPDKLVVHKDGIKASWDEDYENFGMRMQGYLTVPIAGCYDFNVTGNNQVRFYLSTDDKEENKYDQMIETRWGTNILGHDIPQFNGSQTMTSICMQPNIFYYFELLQVANYSNAHTNVYWKGPQYGNQNWHNIPELFVYDYTDELVCIKPGAICDDSNPLTANDIIDNNCSCYGTPCTPGIDCDDASINYVEYDYCATGNSFGTRPDDGWISCDPAPNPYVAERSGFHWIHYDLGNEYQVYNTHVWNYNVPGMTGNGFVNVAVDYSLDGDTWYHLDNFVWAVAPGANTYGGFEGPSFNGMSMRYILFTSLDSPEACRGIGKITFNVDSCPQEGTSCNDANQFTYNDHYNDQCECFGYTLDQLNCEIDTLFLNESEVNPNTFHAVKALISEGQVLDQSDIHYKAGSTILLNSGYEVSLGSEFTAEIEECPGSPIALISSLDSVQQLKKKDYQKESLEIFSLVDNTDQTLRFFISSHSEVILDLLDAEGNVVTNIIHHAYENFGYFYKRIQTRKLTTGVYVVRMKTSTSTSTEKVIVI